MGLDSGLFELLDYMRLISINFKHPSYLMMYVLPCGATDRWESRSHTRDLFIELSHNQTLKLISQSLVTLFYIIKIQ